MLPAAMKLTPTHRRRNGEAEKCWLHDLRGRMGLPGMKILWRAPNRHAAMISFEKALEPLARRMERVKLPADFLRQALVPGSTLRLNALAMRWAGMPNKNERAALREALDALTASGHLERLEEESWKVVRAAD